MQLMLERETENHQHIKVEKVGSKILNALLFRGWKDDGEHSEQYCIELQFKDKRTAISWLKRQKISFTEVEDHQELPWING
jgi:hypothetical protein